MTLFLQTRNQSSKRNNKPVTELEGQVQIPWPAVPKAIILHSRPKAKGLSQVLWVVLNSDKNKRMPAMMDACRVQNSVFIFLRRVGCENLFLFPAVSYLLWLKCEMIELLIDGKMTLQISPPLNRGGQERDLERKRDISYLPFIWGLRLPFLYYESPWKKWKLEVFQLCSLCRPLHVSESSIYRESTVFTCKLHHFTRKLLFMHYWENVHYLKNNFQKR